MTNALSLPPNRNADASASEALETFARIIAALLASLPGQNPPHRTGPLPMLTVQQTAALLGMSRTTVIRKADAGELPCVVMCRGSRQKMRRFPRTAIEDLAAHGSGGTQSDLTEYTKRWLAANSTGSNQLEA
jgi:excisionase family DNA binding protein